MSIIQLKNRSKQTNNFLNYKVPPLIINGYLFDWLRPDESDLFVEEVDNEISPNYPETGISYGSELIRAHHEKPVKNNSTIYKKILGCYKSGNLLGFSVLSFKKDSRVKFGPSIVLKPFRNNGIGKLLRTVGENISCSFGYYSFYSTCSSNNIPAQMYVKKVGYKKIAEIPGIYKSGTIEFVYEKILATNSKVMFNSNFKKVKSLNSIKIDKKRGGAIRLHLPEIYYKTDKYQKTIDEILSICNKKYRSIIIFEEFDPRLKMLLLKEGFKTTDFRKKNSMFNNKIVLTKTYE